MSQYVKRVECKQQATGETVCTRDNSVECACVVCVLNISYLYNYSVDPDVIIMLQDTDPSARPEQPPDSTFGINRVGIRVPPFWPEKPALWFAQLEGQFALSNITQDATKFYYVISQLDNKYAAEVEDVITNPPPTGRYDRIKAEMIRRLSLSEE